MKVDTMDMLGHAVDICVVCLIVQRPHIGHPLAIPRKGDPVHRLKRVHYLVIKVKNLSAI